MSETPGAPPTPPMALLWMTGCHWAANRGQWGAASGSPRSHGARCPQNTQLSRAMSHLEAQARGCGRARRCVMKRVGVVGGGEGESGRDGGAKECEPAESERQTTFALPPAHISLFFPPRARPPFLAWPPVFCSLPDTRPRVQSNTTSPPGGCHPPAASRAAFFSRPPRRLCRIGRAVWFLLLLAARGPPFFFPALARDV